MASRAGRLSRVARTVYIETSIVSYLVARPSRDVVVLARQELTQQWWSGRANFELLVSDLVLQEASAGDPVEATKRLDALGGMRVLELSEESIVLAEKLLRHSGLPAKASADALHVAVSIVHGLDYLLTWNCTHIANASIRRRIEGICRTEGFDPPIICTPEELAEEEP